MRGANTIAENSAETMNELLDMLNSRMSFLSGCLALELLPAAEGESANSLRSRAYLFWRSRPVERDLDDKCPASPPGAISLLTGR